MQNFSLQKFLTACAIVFAGAMSQVASAHEENTGMPAEIQPSASCTTPFSLKTSSKASKDFIPLYLDTSKAVIKASLLPLDKLRKGPSESFTLTSHLATTPSLFIGFTRNGHVYMTTFDGKESYTFHAPFMGQSYPVKKSGILLRGAVIKIEMSKEELLQINKTMQGGTLFAKSCIDGICQTLDATFESPTQLPWIKKFLPRLFLEHVLKNGLINGVSGEKAELILLGTRPDEITTFGFLRTSLQINTSHIISNIREKLARLTSVLGLRKNQSQK